MIARSWLPVSTLVLVALSGNAWSQTPPSEAAPPDTSATPPMAAPMAPPPPLEAAPPAAPPAGPPSFKIDAGPGNTLKVGLLVQPQFQSLGSNALNGNSYNLFIRRTRLLVGGTVLGTFDYFFDTDYPNLFLATNEGPTMTANAVTTKNTPGMNIQDAFITWRPLTDANKDAFKVDAGYMLPPLAHNAVQGAGTLYAWDYFLFSFSYLGAAGTNFGSTSSPVGRDLGVQLRGLVLDGHLEYRLGMFQGVRDSETPAAMAGTATTVGANNFFRVTGRLQLNLFDPEPGFFYAGTYLGKKKILSFGVSGDMQDAFHYYYVAGDGFADLPVGPGVFTAQVNVAHWDGGTFVPALPKQTAFMSEVGFNFNTLFAPIARVEYLWGPANLYHIGGGLAFWPFGHTSNLKAFYTRNYEQGSPHADNQVNVQWQLYFF
ncbi:MAG TPA: hypothetical protein VH853_24145 [Polyangia bacterium]|nr:hypothetical protein [Polyangia bacterium]